VIWFIFANRVGKEGIEKIFRLSVGLQGKDARQKCVSIDTTVQEKNIMFPTDLKLAVRIIAKCRKMAEKQGILWPHQTGSPNGKKTFCEDLLGMKLTP